MSASWRNARGRVPERAVIRLRVTTDVERQTTGHHSSMFNGTRVAAAMTTGVISCEPETPLAEVAEIMAERRVHAVYVFDGDGNELWGLVSDLDLVAAARGELEKLTARDAAAA